MRRVVPLAFGLTAVLLVAFSVLTSWIVGRMEAGNPILTFAVLITLFGLAALAGLWTVVNRYLLRGACKLSREATLIAHGSLAEGAAPRIAVTRYRDLMPVAQAINDLSERLLTTRRDTSRIVAEATARAEEQKTRLGAILRDLHEGVVVCNPQHQIMLYNQTALDILHLTGDLGLGRSLLHFVVADPVLHTLERLTMRVHEGRHTSHEHGTTAQFVGATTDGRILLQGRISVILSDTDSTASASDNGAADQGSSPDKGISGYVLTLSDATGELAALGQRDALLREASEGFRAPIANLRASLETLGEIPDLDGDQRAAFQAMMMESCQQLSERLEQVTSDYRNVITGSWPMSDIHSKNLITLIRHRLGATVPGQDGKTVPDGPFRITVTGLPRWVHGDSFSLVTLFAHLVERVHRVTGATEFELGADVDGTDASANWVYLDLLWHGTPVSSGTVDGWLEDPLPGAFGGMTVGDIVMHHKTTMWSEQVRGHDGRARLRVPLPPAQNPRSTQPRPAVAPRPEFFDFGLLHQPLATSELGGRSLDQLHYVIFDTETTGLSPSGGDEIIQIAAVRVVGGRVLTGETFNTLVNPGRPIPPESVPFHGITDAMVVGQPRIEQVLPAFRAFVSGAVLVAHNAAFDLKFLKMKERVSGVVFDTPVLDTMLLSRMLQGPEGDHTLDGIAERLGIEIIDRHTALGDSLVTAGVFLKMVDMLREREVRSLDDAIRAANILVELAARERAF